MWAARVSGGSASWSSASGIGSIARRRAPGIRDDCRPRTKTCSNERPVAACIAITATRRRTPSRRRRAVGRPALLVAQAGLGHRGDRAGELARRRLRRAAHVRGRELAEARERDEPLDDVGLRGEELAPAQPEAVDQAVDEDVGPRRVERGRGRAVELEEAEDPLARLGRQLRRLGRGDERADHVELAPPRDLHAAREVDRAQLDRRAGERAHDRARRRRGRRAAAATRARP